MENQNPQKYFGFIIGVGKMALGSTRNDIIKLFQNHEMCITEYRNGQEVSKGLEIQFEIGNLTCVFDESEICYMSILYLEQLDKIAYYIRFCDDTFAFDSDIDTWQSPESDMTIKPSDGRIAFIQNGKTINAEC